VKKMKRSISLVSNLLLSSTLFWGVPLAYGEELNSGQVVRVPANEASYCHMKFPPMREDSLSWKQPVFDESSAAIIDFYGSCDYDPLGSEEIRVQRRLKLHGVYGDSE
jgi:hypothetical protein